MPKAKSDEFAEPKCPLKSDSHAEHDRIIIKAHDAVMKASQRIKELEASQVVIPKGQESHTNEILAVRLKDVEADLARLKRKFGVQG